MTSCRRSSVGERCSPSTAPLVMMRAESAHAAMVGSLVVKTSVTPNSSTQDSRKSRTLCAERPVRPAVGSAAIATRGPWRRAMVQSTRRWVHGSRSPYLVPRCSAMPAISSTRASQAGSTARPVMRKWA